MNYAAGADEATRSEVPRFPFSSDAELQQRFIAPGRPVILTGMTDDWPARRWSLDYFAERFGHVLVTAGRTHNGTLQTSERRGIPQVELPLVEYIDMLRAGKPELYLLSPVEERLPELLKDLRPPTIQRNATWHSTRLWLGPSGTCSPLHHDFPDNLYVQVFGRKRLILIDRRHKRAVYPRAPWSGLPNFSRVDAEHPNDPRFPRFARVPRMICVVEPGEVLYIPRLWWHHVRALEMSVSINLWFASGWQGVVARGLQLYAQARGLRR